jgi:hypothetical protein
MLRSGPAAAAALLAALLGGCATQAVSQQENMLLAAGFTFKPADTPEKQAFLKTLPAHQFAYQVHNGRNIWFYADPTVCGCLYAGNDAAYQAYRREVFEKRIADQQLQAAQLNQDSVIEGNMALMGWGPYGAWFPGFE